MNSTQEPKFYEYDTIKIDKARKEEIQDTPRDPGELAERLADGLPATPEDSGGDIDADWEEVDTTGSETVFGHNPTPDQSNVEANAHAMGIDFQDNEPLDFEKKMEKRDRDRFELDEDSRSNGMI